MPSSLESRGLDNLPSKDRQEEKSLYEFPVVAEANDHSLGDLKQYKFIFLRFWRSGVQN